MLRARFWKRCKKTIYLQIAPRAARGEVQHFALLPVKGGILFPKRIPPFEPPEKGEGCPPSTPDIAGFRLEGLHALRSAGAVYVASP